MPDQPINVNRTKTLMEYIAEYLNKLPATHSVNVAFGTKLVYVPSPIGDEKRNVYLFAFPSTVESELDANMGRQFDIPNNIALSPKPGVCITPAIGGTPRYAMGAWSPSFTILCRNEYHGRAYQCAQELIYTLNLKSQVFPQNGCIFATASQPRLVYSSSGGASSTYAADFGSKVAERIL